MNKEAEAQTQIFVSVFYEVFKDYTEEPYFTLREEETEDYTEQIQIFCVSQN